MRVLIAEDDPTARVMLQRAVERLGHECVAVVDGERAWETLRLNPTDVVLSDWTMPGLDGPNLCRRIRAAEHLPFIYFMLLTVHDDAAHVIDGLKSGADDYLLKPISLDDLRARLLLAERITRLHTQIVDLGTKYQHLDALNKAAQLISRLMSSERDTALSVSKLVGEAARVLGADRGGLYRHIAGSGSWLPIHSKLNPRDEVEFWRALDELRAGSDSALTDLPVVIDAEQAPSDDGQALLAVLQSRWAIVAPVSYHGGFLGNLIVASNHRPEAFQTEDSAVLELFAALAAPELDALGHWNVHRSRY